MKLRKVTLFILILIVGFVSCKNDDDSGGVIIEERDRTEQQIVDNDSIVGYLQTHYYNKSQFDGNTNPKIKDLVITEITDEIISSDADSLLINAVETKTVNYADTDYEYYILRLNQGGSTDSPTFADNVIVTYEGFTLDNEIFDSAVTPLTFDLTSVIPAWRKVLPQFNTAESFVENGDGTVDYLNHGTGVMFVPSGLGYYSGATGSISSYSPLVFKFELYKMAQNDHDGDGVPSYLEDLNGDGEFIVNFEDLTVDTDDDTDGDGVPNYVDSDDDGDGILTINEDLNEDGDPTNDIGANNIPNYLDPEETASKNDN
ncbi:peptidylprolyl isomerase [Sabulilitoribacter multivorans]|uniref:peptidylprolyl isomerase n=1 Tax=Flaviramulus multivorans TaxID=1304750 RepID=A0ABS9IMH1_9FLAO|nr:peptidylprolyl isomerase [Flaviramulus multivorans]MCF7561747.1 peptidylprolyl isomerase [Flaviramulus multivorans]